MLRRRISLLGLVTVMVAGCASVTQDAPPGPVGSPSGTASGTDAVGPLDPTSPPDPRIPAEAMLTGEDVGPGYTAAEWLQGDDHGSIGMMLAYCGVDEYTEAFDHEITFRRGSVGINLGDGVESAQFVLETVRRSEPGWAQRYLDDLATAVPGCPSVAIMGDPSQIATMTIIDADFIGDGSLLIRDESSQGTQFHAVVRQGDVMAELRIHTGGDEDHARAIVHAAAERLCAADPC